MERDQISSSLLFGGGPHIGVFRGYSAALTPFAGLPTVTLEAPSVAPAALEALARGIDFADALHLGGARDCDAFVTFDRAFAKAADGLGGAPVRTA
jgi:predicted nucleic acid-binding protein